MARTTPSTFKERINIVSEFTFRDQSVKYEWRFVILEDDKKYSDWDNAANCSCCGRQIVHVMWINGQAVGRECFASMLLGKPETLQDEIKASKATEGIKKAAKKAMIDSLCNTNAELRIASEGRTTPEIARNSAIIRAL